MSNLYFIFMRKWDISKCEKFQFVIQNLMTESTSEENDKKIEKKEHFRFMHFALKIYNQTASINHCFASHCKVKLSSSFRWFNYSYWMLTRSQFIWKETQAANKAKCHWILNRMSHLSEFGANGVRSERMLWLEVKMLEMLDSFSVNQRVTAEDAKPKMWFKSCSWCWRLHSIKVLMK